MQKVYSDVIQKKFNADDPESTKVILQSYKDAR